MSLNIVEVTPDFALTAQITPKDVADLAARGFKSIINNRPDGEGGPAQPTSEDLEREARRHGMHYAYLPVATREVDACSVDEFARVFEAAPRPVIAFCRTGARSQALFHALAAR